MTNLNLPQKSNEHADRQRHVGYACAADEDRVHVSEPNIHVVRMLACVAAVAAALLLIWPAGEIGFGDDVAFSHVALRLAQTGHLIFNGWEAVMMLSHAYWGALIIKLFGFSPLHMRLSTAPFALGVVVLCYRMCLRAGLASSAATLVTLMLGLSPIFLPYAVSYMTDVPGLFFFLAALLVLTGASEASSGWKSHLRLVFGTCLALVGGTGRQVVWFIPLVVLPYLAWVRRREIKFAIACGAAWCVSFLCVVETTAWFNQQPYVVPMPSLFSEFKMALHQPRLEIDAIARTLLMLLWMCLPAALPLVVRSAGVTWRGGRGRKTLVGALLLGVVLAVCIHPSLASIPWLASTLNWEGISGGGMPGLPIVLIRPIRAVAALSVYAAACILAGELFRAREFGRRLWKALLQPTPAEFTVVAMLSVCVVYFAAIMIRTVEFDPFDRYLLPIMPCVSIVLLLLSEEDNGRGPELPLRVMPAAWSILLIMGAYSVLSAHDYWSVARARVAATAKLEAAGIPRTAIDSGMEYNFWTQLLVNGHLNWHWVRTPPDAFRPGFGHTPDVVPEYRLEYTPVQGETERSEYSSVPYLSMFPPFRKKVCIDHILRH